MSENKNIILIGMPASGKSTIGVLLAKALGMNFLDTDIYIQALQSQSLQQIIDTQGIDAFCRIEQDSLLLLQTENTLIATGGSVVYSPEAMARLKGLGTVIFLDITLDEIKKRLTNISTRGVVKEPGQDLESLYKKRLPLYKQFADITIDCNELNHEQTVEAIINNL